MASFNPLRALTATSKSSTPRFLCQQQQRTFTASTPLNTKTITPSRLPKNIIPPYPYGERRIYKQSNKGLYGSARIRFGNNVSEAHNVKTGRFWRPNVHVKVYYSESLGARVKTRLTMRVLKTIKREGGLENYILKDKPARVKELGPGGWKLKWLLMQTRAVQERYNAERVAMGLEPVEVEDREDVVQYALDAATPGKLSERSKLTLQEIQLEEAFSLGDAQLDAGIGEELTPEMEEALLRALDEYDGEAEVDIKKQDKSLA